MGRNALPERPGSVPEHPKTAPRRPKTAPRRPKTAQDDPKTAQDGPKMAPRRPKTIDQLGLAGFAKRLEFPNMADWGTGLICMVLPPILYFNRCQSLALSKLSLIFKLGRPETHVEPIFVADGQLFRALNAVLDH